MPRTDICYVGRIAPTVLGAGLIFQSVMCWFRAPMFQTSVGDFLVQAPFTFETSWVKTPVLYLKFSVFFLMSGSR